MGNAEAQQLQAVEDQHIVATEAKEATETQQKCVKEDAASVTEHTRLQDEAAAEAAQAAAVQTSKDHLEEEAVAVVAAEAAGAVEQCSVISKAAAVGVKTEEECWAMEAVAEDWRRMEVEHRERVAALERLARDEEERVVLVDAATYIQRTVRKHVRQRRRRYSGGQDTLRASCRRRQGSVSD